MKLPSKKKIAITALIIAAVGLLTIVGVLVAVGITNRAKVSADDLAEMKTLVHKYLNDRNRMLVKSTPDREPGLLNVSTIQASEMSQQLAARQKVDVEKIRAMTKSIEDQGVRYWNRLETKVEIEKTTVASGKTVERIFEYTRLFFIPGMGTTGKGAYSSFNAERDFTFVRNGDKWIISDVKVPHPGTMPPPNEPSVEPEIPSDEEMMGTSKKKIAITAFVVAAVGLLTVVGVLMAVRMTHRPGQKRKETHKMKVTSKKKITITALIIAAVGLLTVAGVLVAVGMTHWQKVTISVDDLAEMKTLVHKYLNERNRMVVCADPENNPNIAGAPVIDPSEMSHQLAARQAEDVETLRAKAPPSNYTDPWNFDDFATWTRVFDIRKDGDDVVLDIHDATYYIPIGLVTMYGGEGNERHYTFARKGNRWILKDAKLTFVESESGITEPNVKGWEAGTSRVLEKRPEEITKIPEKIAKLDEAATRKITNKWAIDRETAVVIKKWIGDPITDSVSPFTTQSKNPREQLWPYGQPIKTLADFPDGQDGANVEAVIRTDKGNIVLEFFPDSAPITVASFIHLARTGFYNGTRFHRVTPGFEIVGGDPRSKDPNAAALGMGGPDYYLPGEFSSSRPRKTGTLGLVKSNNPNSGGSQFFIHLADQPSLDGEYTMFGQVISGMDVVNEIAAGDVINEIVIIPKS